MPYSYGGPGYPRYPRGRRYARRRLAKNRFNQYRAPKLRGRFGSQLRGN